MNTPEIGSKWTYAGMELEVVKVNKRGRMAGVFVTWTASGDIGRFLLRDFLKGAKPL